MFQPEIFGKYLLMERLASGGMAEIFKAKVFGVDGFEKPMVVKQILPQYNKNREFVEMFIDEAKITVSLSHGNIVTVYELGRIDGVYFIAMEYVDGPTLRHVLRQLGRRGKVVPPAIATAITKGALKALGSAHEQKDE